jgi:hypothetical protein
MDRQELGLRLALLVRTGRSVARALTGQKPSEDVKIG